MFLFCVDPNRLSIACSSASSLRSTTSTAPFGLQNSTITVRPSFSSPSTVACLLGALETASACVRVLAGAGRCLAPVGAFDFAVELCDGAVELCDGAVEVEAGTADCWV